MEIDREKLNQAKLDVAKRLKEGEKDRARLRLAKGLKELEARNFTILSNDRFVNELTRYICDIEFMEQSDSFLPILESIGEGCCSDSREVRERALVIITVFSEYVLEIERFDFIGKLAEILIAWLEGEDEYLSGFMIICQQLQKIAIKLLSYNHWEEVENLLILLNKIQNGTIKKSNTIKGTVAKVLESIATVNVLDRLTQTYLDTLKKGHKRAGRLLRNLGRRAVIYLLNKLMHSNDKMERFRLMGLIPQTGSAVAPVFQECLEKNPPWYVIRNIMSMIAEIGDPSLYFLVENGLHHRDIRVQQEAITCITKLGGSEMKNRLISALENISDELKVGVVMKLGQFKGNDVTAAFFELFEKRTSFADSIADELLLALCIVFKSFPKRRTAQCLRHLIAEQKEKRNPSDKLMLIAEEALSEIEPKVRHDLKGETDALDMLAFGDDPMVEHVAKRKVRDLLDEVQKIVGKGNVGKASELLYTEAIASAKNKEFRVAEILRDKILDINPIALAEVLEVGEIIEEERSTSISSHHIEIWSELYDEMSTEEFNALYAALKKETYNPGETIIKNGETDPCLFFIYSGIVHLSCMCGNKETFLKRMQPGEIIGIGPFFSLSVWTVSLVSQNTTQIQVLDRDRFVRIKERFPYIETKLHEYCKQFDTVPTLLRMAGEDRREYARYTVPLSITSITLDPYGKKRQYSFEGEMIDVSRGGLSFQLRMSRGMNSKFLLGRQIISEIQIDNKNKLKCSGVIVSVGFPTAELVGYSIHVKFTTLMSQADFTRVNKIA